MRKNKAKPDSPSTFTWKGETYNLSDFSEFRYWQDHDKGVFDAAFVKIGGGLVGVSVANVTEAREIEAAVNPYWGRT
jgi:hypothetical protein